MRYQKKPGVLERESGGEIVLLDSETDQVHQLNQTAALVWQLCESESPLEQISSQLVERFGIEQEIAERDVGIALQQLVDLQLVMQPD